MSFSKNDSSRERAHARLREMDRQYPVVIRGHVKARKAKPDPEKTLALEKTQVTNVEIQLTEILPLNDFPKEILMNDNVVIPASQRHLQIRMDKGLRDALALRSKAARLIRDELCENHGFTEIETPLLFKSTPEGAREFLVPTRTPGQAYALPQSPQQYKQILMASGIPRYLQFARCFRDEDLRADRQPEFTQVDLEMSFAKGDDVRKVIEAVIRRLWASFLQIDVGSGPFATMSYEDAMATYGSDKPDLRLGSKVCNIEIMIHIN